MFNKFVFLCFYLLVYFCIWKSYLQWFWLLYTGLFSPFCICKQVRSVLNLSRLCCDLRKIYETIRIYPLLIFSIELVVEHSQTLLFSNTCEDFKKYFLKIYSNKQYKSSRLANRKILQKNAICELNMKDQINKKNQLVFIHLDSIEKLFQLISIQCINLGLKSAINFAFETKIQDIFSIVSIH